MDIEQHSTLEKHLLELIEVATDMARGKDEALKKIEQVEESLKQMTKDYEKLKRERTDEHEATLSRDRKYQDEKAHVTIELERLRTNKEELEAKCESFRVQNEAMQARLSQQQTTASSLQAHTSMSVGSGQRLSHLMTKEVIDQISEVHEMLKSLEGRANVVCSNAARAEAHSTEMGKLAETSQEVLRKSQHELETVRAVYREAVARSRADAVKISALNLDVEGLQEQVNRLREEVVHLSQHRRNLEIELERTKLTVATSIMPLLEKSVIKNTMATAAAIPSASLEIVPAASSTYQAPLTLQDGVVMETDDVPEPPPTFEDSTSTPERSMEPVSSVPNVAEQADSKTMTSMSVASPSPQKQAIFIEAEGGEAGEEKIT